MYTQADTYIPIFIYIYYIHYDIYEAFTAFCAKTNYSDVLGIAETSGSCGINIIRMKINHDFKICRLILLILSRHRARFFGNRIYGIGNAVSSEHPS